jgi:hypothetical protein
VIGFFENGVPSILYDIGCQILFEEKRPRVHNGAANGLFGKQYKCQNQDNLESGSESALLKYNIIQNRMLYRAVFAFGSDAPRLHGQRHDGKEFAPRTEGEQPATGNGNGGNKARCVPIVHVRA